MWLYSCKYYCRKETGLEDVGDAFTNNPATRTAHSKQQHRREISCSNVSRYSHCRHLELGWGEVSKSTCFFGNIFSSKKLVEFDFFRYIFSYAAIQLIGIRLNELSSRSSTNTSSHGTFPPSAPPPPPPPRAVGSNVSVR